MSSEVGWAGHVARTGEMNNMHSSSNIIGVSRSSEVGWVGHVARIGDMNNLYT